MATGQSCRRALVNQDRTSSGVCSSLMYKCKLTCIQMNVKYFLFAPSGGRRVNELTFPLAARHRVIGSRCGGTGLRHFRVSKATPYVYSRNHSGLFAFMWSTT